MVEEDTVVGLLLVGSSRVQGDLQELVVLAVELKVVVVAVVIWEIGVELCLQMLILEKVLFFVEGLGSVDKVKSIGSSLALLSFISRFCTLC